MRPVSSGSTAKARDSEGSRVAIIFNGSPLFTGDAGSGEKDRAAFISHLQTTARKHDLRLTASELRAILSALGEREETVEICRDSHGNPEPDPDLRDTETVPLKESIDDYFKREVLPHVPDAWIDHTKTRIGVNTATKATKGTQTVFGICVVFRPSRPCPTPYSHA